MTVSVCLDVKCTSAPIHMCTRSLKAKVHVASSEDNDSD